MADITIKITDREGVLHEVQAPTDMAMNLMEVVRSFELHLRGPLEFVVVWQCVHHVNVM